MNYKRLEDISRNLKAEYKTGKNFHVTFVYQGNKLLVMGVNDYTKSHKTSKFGEYKSSRKDCGDYVACIHSEIDSLTRLGLTDCKHLKFINVRIDNHGNPAISKPCRNCERVLQLFRFKSLTYYDGSKYVKEKFGKYS